MKALIFDLNGVIIESTDTNAQIYAKIFEPYGQQTVQKVVEHYKQFGGIPRQKRIEIYLRQFANVEPTQELINQLSEKFSQLYFESLKHAQFVDGVFEFMQHTGKKYDKFLSSGAPEQDLPKILQILGLEQFFIKSYGAPQKKSEHIAQILKTYKYPKDQVAFIGDSPKDREAARENGIIFIARPRGLKSLENEKYKINDFYDLARLLESIEHQQQTTGNQL